MCLPGLASSSAITTMSIRTYPQLHGPFLPFMTAIDLLFNVGPDSLAVVRAGQRATLAPSEL